MNRLEPGPAARPSSETKRIRRGLGVLRLVRRHEVGDQASLGVAGGRAESGRCAIRTYLHPHRTVWRRQGNLVVPTAGVSSRPLTEQATVTTR